MDINATFAIDVYVSFKISESRRACPQTNKCQIELPNEHDKFLQFNNYDRREEMPFVIYADLELLLIPKEDWRVIQEHEVYSFGFHIKCSFDNILSIYKSYRWVEYDDPSQWFVPKLRAVSADLQHCIIKSAKSSNIEPWSKVKLASPWTSTNQNPQCSQVSTSTVVEASRWFQHWEEETMEE